MLLHGALANESQFASFTKKIADNFETITYTFPGHKIDDTWDGSFCFRAFTDSLVSFIKSCQLKKISVFGYSMGGYTALYLAYLYPDLLGKIVTLGTNLFWTSEIADKHTSKLIPEMIEAKVPAYADHLRRQFGQKHWKTVLSKTAQLMRELGNKDLLTPDVLSRIKNDVTMAIGEYDEMVSQDATLEATRHLPNSDFLVVPDSKHPFEKTNEKWLANEFQRLYS